MSTSGSGKVVRRSKSHGRKNPLLSTDGAEPTTTTTVTVDTPVASPDLARSANEDTPGRKMRRGTTTTTQRPKSSSIQQNDNKIEMGQLALDNKLETRIAKKTSAKKNSSLGSLLDLDVSAIDMAKMDLSSPTEKKSDGDIGDLGKGFEPLENGDSRKVLFDSPEFVGKKYSDPLERRSTVVGKVSDPAERGLRKKISDSGDSRKALSDSPESVGKKGSDPLEKGELVKKDSGSVGKGEGGKILSDSLEKGLRKKVSDSPGSVGRKGGSDPLERRANLVKKGSDPVEKGSGVKKKF